MKKSVEPFKEPMTLLEWWIEHGDEYGMPYNAQLWDEMLWVDRRDDGIGIKDMMVYSDYDAINSFFTFKQEYLNFGIKSPEGMYEAYDIVCEDKKEKDAEDELIRKQEEEEEERLRKETRKGETYYDTGDRRNYNVSRAEGKEMISQECYNAIENVIDGKTSLRPVSSAFPAFYDVTEWVAEGSRPITGTLPENRLGWSKTDNFRDLESPEWYRIYNEKTGEVDYYSAKYIMRWYLDHQEYKLNDEGVLKIIEDAHIEPSQSYTPEMSNREAFFRELLPDYEPRQVIKRVGGHWGQVYKRGDWEQGWIEGRYVWESADDRAMLGYGAHISVVEFTRDLRNAGFIVKVGDRDILCCAYDNEGYFIDFKEAMKQFNNKGHDPATGLTYRQEVQMLLSQGTLHTRALDGKEFNIDEVIEAGRLELERAGAKLSRSDYPWGWQEVKEPEEDISKDKTYWEIREAQNEQEWLDIAESTASIQDKMLTRCCNEVIDKLNKFYESIEAGHVPTRGELLRNEQYRQTILAIQSKLSSEGQQNLTVIKGSMEQIVKTVNLSVLTKGMINATVNTEYKGENYSSRVWNNTRTLATRLESTIEDCIIAGRNIQEATTKIKHEFSVARYQAERLLRTETARVYTRATEDSFASAGIDEVKILVERGACEECAKLKGKTWKRGEQPTLPVHPNCRCALAPVVKARYKKEK